MTSTDLTAPRQPTVSVPVGLLHQLLVAATVDSKTGVLTSAGWHSRAVEALRRPATEPAWGLLMVDLDRFAALNATYGHPAADHVLVRAAAALRAAAGAHGVVGRFGGDEFVVLVPARNRAALHHAGECARLAVATLADSVDRPDSRVHITGVTASVGGALYRPRWSHEPELAELLWSADTALYAAKHAGGDTVRTVPMEG